MDTPEPLSDFKLPPGKSVMAIMSREGDTKTIWDKNNADETEAARVQFNTLTAKGFTAFYVTGKEGEKGSKMKEFDKNAEKIIFVPRMQGG